MKKALWATLSPMLCIFVGVSYRYFNEYYVTQWWVHCKHCVLGEAPRFDANDFTILFFSVLCVLATVPLFQVFKQARWLWMSVALISNAFICIYFMTLNIWV